jgi:hypothetical protein
MTSKGHGRKLEHHVEQRDQTEHDGAEEVHDTPSRASVTTPLSSTFRNNLSSQNEDPVVPIPFVPVTMVYTLPEPGHPIAGSLPKLWKFLLCHSLLTQRVNTRSN